MECSSDFFSGDYFFNWEWVLRPSYFGDLVKFSCCSDDFLMYFADSVMIFLGFDLVMKMPRSTNWLPPFLAGIVICSIFLFLDFEYCASSDNYADSFDFPLINNNQISLNYYLIPELLLAVLNWLFHYL